MTLLWLKGLLIGLIIALPLGPVGLLCVHRTMSGGARLGIASGLGSSLADTVYAFLAAFGLTWMADFLQGHTLWVHITGGSCLLVMGIWLLFSDRNVNALYQDDSTRLVKAFISTFVLTITNPLVFLVFTASFAGVGVGHTKTEFIHAVAAAIGVFMGSFFWYAVVAFSGESIRDRILTHLPVIKRICGVTIIMFGLAALLSA